MSIRVNKEKINQWLRNTSVMLNKPYKPVNNPPFAILITTGVIYTLGLFYLWAFFDFYNIRYFLYFDLKDSLAVLYEKLMLIVFISIVISPFLIILHPKLTGTKKRNSKAKSKFSNLSIALVMLIFLGVILVFLQVYEFAYIFIILFLVMAAGSGYVYLYEYPSLGICMLLSVLFLFVFSVAKIEAKHATKAKLKTNIVLKSHSEVPILRENDSCKYLIFKTSNYYFIKDDCRHLIITYNASSGEMTSFTPK
ncbi:hypothetical protein [Chryseobacterium lathyri]|uniref:hypothetical protein n=1 Tax=Chryseobacterium lathyri TaxID=395933 RepID=UPI001CC0112E|nr:hypothetical protein [Chryseobacterium lathyri]